MANPIAFLARRNAKRLADFAVSNPLIRWVWTGPGNEDYASALSEFRPTDRESVLEMMQDELKKAGSKSEIRVYADAGHGFNADFRNSYREADAKDGWARMLAWFKANGVA